MQLSGAIKLYPSSVILTRRKSKGNQLRIKIQTIEPFEFSFGRSCLQTKSASKPQYNSNLEKYLGQRAVLHNALERPLTLLGSVEDLPTLVGQVGLAVVTRDMLEEHRLPCLLVGLTLAGLLALSFFQLDLHLRGLAELFGVDSICDATPKGQGLVG